ncbi:MAG: GH25 family lysozyme [Chloroflexota bacterium]
MNGLAYTPGIDVSHWQGRIDWTAVKAAGVQFAYIKATDGGSFLDPSFASNWSGAQAAGLLRGAYHFFRPIQDPQKQAEFFLKTAVLSGSDLPPALDLEVSDNLKSATIIQRVEIWVQAVEAQIGRPPVIYSGVSFLNDFFTTPAGGPPLWTRDHLLWIANYLGPTATQPNMPMGWNQWAFWQHSASGKVSGINGNVDLDWFNGAPEQLQALARKPDIAVGQVYTAQAGDSLPSIASKFNRSLAALVEANPQLVQPGAAINIPVAAPVEPQSPGTDTDPGSGSAPRTYVIQPGDTLSAIAARFNTTLAALIQANSLADPNLIQIGQRLIIP